MIADVFIRLVDMPPSARGFIAPDEDGNMNIYINARLSKEGQRDALLHELRHAENGDCFSDAIVHAIECG